MNQSKRFSKSLQGLIAVTVWVYDVAEDARLDGLSRQHLHDAVVVKLLDAGIRALGIGNVPEPPGNPWLNIFVNTVRSGDIYFYTVTVRLDETIRLDRNRGFKTIGTTWEVCSSGAIARSDMALRLESAVEELVEHFIYDFHYANPVK
jgi:hypothetical protein